MSRPARRSGRPSKVKPSGRPRSTRPPGRGGAETAGSFPPASGGKGGEIPRRRGSGAASAPSVSDRPPPWPEPITRARPSNPHGVFWAAAPQVPPAAPRPCGRPPGSRSVAVLRAAVENYPRRQPWTMDPTARNATPLGFRRMPRRSRPRRRRSCRPTSAGGRSCASPPGGLELPPLVARARTRGSRSGTSWGVASLPSGLNAHHRGGAVLGHQRAGREPLQRERRAQCVGARSWAIRSANTWPEPGVALNPPVPQDRS